MALSISRGDIVWVDFGPVRGVCKAGPHPAIVVQNDVGNAVSPMTIVVPLTDTAQFKHLPVQVLLTSAETGLANKDSCAEAGHVTAIDRAQIDDSCGVLGHLDPPAMSKVDRALKASLAL